MISINGLDYIKVMAEIQANLIPGGILFGIVEGDTVTWVKSSDSFNLDVLSVGTKLSSNSTTLIAIREKRTITQNVPRSVYGTRLAITSIPIVNDAGEAIGAFAMAIPRLHPVVKAFNDFAPILSEMFPEGSLIYITDLEKVISRQSSKKFDIPMFKAGNKFGENDLPNVVINTKQLAEEERDKSRFGVPVLETCYPLFDEDNPNEIVATFGIITPKEVAANLRDMSGNLESSLSGISAAIQELAASAAQIHANEQDLNSEIKQVIGLSEEINEVSTFIKEIADETKMLGLNAAIEAARAGEAGRGFGVVAEEIRKLSEQSKSTVPKIKKLTDDIKLKVDESSRRSQNSLATSQEQAAATEEISASIEEITSMTEELNKIAQKL